MQGLRQKKGVVLNQTLSFPAYACGDSISFEQLMFRLIAVKDATTGGCLNHRRSAEVLAEDLSSALGATCRMIDAEIKAREESRWGTLQLMTAPEIIDLTEVTDVTIDDPEDTSFVKLRQTPSTVALAEARLQETSKPSMVQYHHSNAHQANQTIISSGNVHDI